MLSYLRYSSLLSAYGMALADVAVDSSEPFPLQYSPSALSVLNGRFEALKAKGLEQILSQGIEEHKVIYECYLNLRYRGSDTKLMILKPKDGDFAKAFIEQHRREFAFVLDAPIDVENVRVRAIGLGEDSDKIAESTYVRDLNELPEVMVAKDKHFGTNQIFFEENGEFVTAPLYRLEDLQPGTTVPGPAIMLDKTQTILLHPQNVARVLRSHVLYVPPRSPTADPMCLRSPLTALT